MATTPVRPDTDTGVSELVVVPLPSWPEVPRPQASTVPVEVRARPWSSPAAMATMPDSPDTDTGVSELEVAPLPSSPLDP